LKKLLVTGVAAAALSLAPTAAFAPPAPAPAPIPAVSSKVVVPWVMIGCAGGIILSAFHANYRDNRELTQPEAWTCGLLYWFSYPTPKQQIRRARRS
jgi:hypothetical protein